MAWKWLRLVGLAAMCLARPTIREVSNQADFEKLLMHHAKNTGLPVVVDFYSDSCGPCRMIAPAYKKLAEEYKGRAVFAKVNVATNRETAGKLGIRSMPTFHFYLGGKKKSEFSGAGESQMRQDTERIVSDASRANVALSLESLQEFYAAHDASKSAEDLAKIFDKCTTLSGAGGACAGGAARELCKKLKAKFGAAPALAARFGDAANSGEKVSGKASSAKGSDRTRSKKAEAKAEAKALSDRTTDELLAELASRGEAGDEVASAASEGAAAFAAEAFEAEDFEDFEEYEEETLPTYRPQRSFAERVVILGGGPAGLAAAVYAARAGLAPIVVAPPGGGQLLGKGVTIENYPGVWDETGPGLVARMQRHAADVGAVFYEHAAVAVDLSHRPFVVACETGENISTHALIVATGANSKWLGVEGEETFKGGGVSSCATCDGFIFRDKQVAVVGGGDTAMEDALVLARTSSAVTLIHRRDSFRASHAMVARVEAHPKIKVLWNATVEAFRGTLERPLAEQDEDEDFEDFDEDAPAIATLNSLRLRDTHTGELSTIDVAACFVAIGHDPNTGLFAGQLERDATGYLTLAGTKFATELFVPGVFAAGDVADPTYRQAITSAGSGAAAALDAERYLSEHGIGDESEQFNDDLMAELMGERTTRDDNDRLYTDDAKAEL